MTPMIVLGIESSCDDTAVALLADDHRGVITHKTLTQLRHQDFGGVVPEIAARAHLEHIGTLVTACLAEAGIDPAGITAVAATVGPGLIGGLVVGATFGKAYAIARDIPFIGINHLEGHALSPLLAGDVAFPFLLLLVSGGHCQILSVNGVGDYTLYGTTKDDAIGECLDKSAKMMGLAYPGGPLIEQLALACPDRAAAARAVSLPRPLMGDGTCDFSLSGLKSAVRRHIEQLPAGDIPRDTAAAIAASLENAVADVVTDRLENAITRFKADHARAFALSSSTPPHTGAAHVPALVVAGGVAANAYLRATLETLAAKHGLSFAAPPMKYCTDNGAMIALAALLRLKAGETGDITARTRPRWPLADLTQPPSAKAAS